jgi:hypothetical protein
VTATARLDDGAWQIACSDRGAAEAHLARRLVDLGATVAEIRPGQRSLEDIYLEITGGTNGEAPDDD